MADIISGPLAEPKDRRGLLRPEYSLDGGLSWQPWTGSQSIGDLAVGERVTVLLRGVVDPLTTGILTNVAQVSSPTPDPNPDNNTATVETPVTEQADLSVVKVGAPKPAAVGDLVTYTLAVANAGPVNAENTVLSDPLPDALASPEVSLDGGRSFQPWAGTLALGTLLPGQAQTILLRGTVRASTDALLINTATVQSDTPDPNPDNNTDTEELPVQLAADLAITKLGSPSPVSAGGLLTYTLDLTNLGPAYAQNVSLTDPLPPPLSDGAYSLDNGGTWQPWTGSLALGTLPAGDHRQILLRGTVAQGTSGTLTNTATVASDTPDPRPENNESTALTPVDTAADLALTKSGAPNPVLHGQALVYTLSLTNLGPDPAVHPVLTDPLSPLLLEPAFSTNGGATWQPWAGTWQPGSLAPGQRVELLLRGTVSLEAEGILVNTAVVTSDTPDPNPDNNQATERTPIDTAADLAVLKQVQPARVHPGETLTYTLQVTNAGPSAAQDVVLQDPLPAAILSPVFSADGGATWQPWSSTYVLRTLLPGTTATLLLQGQVDPSTTASSLENTALVTSSTPDPNPDNNEDTVEVPLLPSADLSVRKENTGGSAVPGTPFLYTITLQNAGPSDAQDVLLTDAVPAELWAPEFSTDSGATWTPWHSPYLLGTLAAGASRSLLLRGTIDPAATLPLLNTAVAASSTPDPDLTNNTAQREDPLQPAADLAITKVDDTDTAAPGGLLTYTLTIANLGPATAQDVLLTDQTPGSLSRVEVSLDNGRTWTPWTGAYSLGALPAGQGRTLLLRGSLSSSAQGTLVNTAVVASSTPDPNPNSNTATSLVPVQGSTELRLTKTSPCWAVPCQYLVYRLVAVNWGSVPAEGVVVQDHLPPSLSAGVYSLDGGITWRPWQGLLSFGTLAPGATVTLLVAGVVHPGAQGTITNTAVISSQTAGQSTAAVTTPVWPPQGYRPVWHGTGC